MKKIIKAVLIVLLGIVCLGLINAYLFVPELQRQGDVVAYRGGGSLVNYDKLSQTGCTAISLKPSGINSVENTLEAVSSSVSAGASIIHLNIHRTSDSELVVFHDWTLDCATNGAGPVQESSFEQLKNLDAGYGYTFDNGLTFPFRGKGFQISKLADFYKQYPEHQFWLNLKNNDSHSFETLYTFISDKKSNSTIITSSKGIEWFRSKDSSLKLTSVDSVKKCGLDYLIVGWAGVIPSSCENTILLIPPSMAKYFWGYPDRIASRFQKHNSNIYLWSKHESLDLSYAEIVASGIGVVTSDLDFIHAVKANKRPD